MQKLFVPAMPGLKYFESHHAEWLYYSEEQIIQLSLSAQPTLPPIYELQNPTHDVSVLNRSPDIKALKLINGRSGSCSSHMRRGQICRHRQNNPLFAFQQGRLPPGHKFILFYFRSIDWAVRPTLSKILSIKIRTSIDCMQFGNVDRHI